MLTLPAPLATVAALPTVEDWVVNYHNGWPAGDVRLMEVPLVFLEKSPVAGRRSLTRLCRDDQQTNVIHRPKPICCERNSGSSSSSMSIPSASWASKSP